MLGILVGTALAGGDPCADLEPCVVVERLKADGGEVVHVAHAKAVPGDWRSGLNPGECVKRTYWWVPAKGASRKVLEVCNDGYGASGVGEDTIEVRGGVFSHQRYGGSAWRWAQEADLQLEPPRLLRESSTSMYMVQTVQDLDWSWKDFRGTGRFDVQTCADRDELVEVAYVPIPAVAAVEGMDWTKTALGRCAAVIDSAVGPVLHGGAGKAGDARMKVAKLGADLVVEVFDDRFVAKADSWLHTDHVELWGRFEPRPTTECVDAFPAKQWAFMLDGSTEVAHGSPRPLRAEVVRGEGWARWRIANLPDLDGLTVVYSDSDDGERQERLIATSPVRFAHGETVGYTHTIEPEHAVCRVEGGALKVVETRDFPTDRSMLESTP